MSADSTPVLDVVEQIYDAVADRRRWPHALAALARLTNGSVAFLLPQPKSGTRPGIASSDVPPADAAAYFDHWSHYDPLVNKVQQAPDGAMSEIRRADCGGSPFFLHFADPRNLASGLGAASASNELVLVLWGTHVQGFDSAHVRVFSQVWRHVRRAWALQSSWIASDDGQFDSAQALIEQWPVGVVGLAGHGGVKYANRCARTIAASGDGFGLASDGPVGRSPVETRRLRGAIRSVAEKAGAEEWLRLTRHSALRAYEVALRRIQLPAGAVGDIVMFVTDPEKPHHVPESALRALYGLTSKEAAVAQRLVHGLSPEMIALDRRISLRTTRWYLEQLRGKLGVTNQAELVRLILTGPIGLSLAHPAPLSGTAKRQPDR